MSSLSTQTGFSFSSTPGGQSSQPLRESSRNNQPSTQNSLGGAFEHRSLDSSPFSAKSSLDGKSGSSPFPGTPSSVRTLGDDKSSFGDRKEKEPEASLDSSDQAIDFQGAEECSDALPAPSLLHRQQRALFGQFGSGNELFLWAGATGEKGSSVRDSNPLSATFTWDIISPIQRRLIHESYDIFIALQRCVFS